MQFVAQEQGKPGTEGSDSVARAPARRASLTQRVEAALEPILAHDGFELVWVEYLRHSQILRLYIDHADGITLDHCSQVSRTVSDVLDAEATAIAGIDGAYTLEVSSPGLDRPLVRPAHYSRFIGQDIQVVRHATLPGHPAQQRKFTGTLRQADADGIRLEVDGELHTLAYDAIDRARLVPRALSAATGIHDVKEQGMDGNLSMVLDQVSKDKGIDRMILIRALEEAILAAAKRTFGAERNLNANFNGDKGAVDLTQTIRVVADLQDSYNEITLDECKGRGIEVEADDEMVFPIYFLDQDAQAAVSRTRCTATS